MFPYSFDIKDLRRNTVIVSHFTLQWCDGVRGVYSDYWVYFESGISDRFKFEFVFILVFT